jgi:MYXO-CTERM domain-containing protein
MRSPSQLPVSSCLGLALGLLLFPASEARADLSVSNIGLYTGGSTPIDPNSTIVEIAFTGNSGIWVYSDAQTASNWTYSGGSSIPLYCIDLAHDTYLGSTYKLTNWTNPNSISADALNRVAWAVENASAAGYGPAAAQLLSWKMIDPNFQVINWYGETAIESAYNTLVSSMSSHYNSGTSYLSQAQFFDADHQPSTANQDLAVWIPPGGLNINGIPLGPFSSPEPSSLVVAGFGALGLVGYGWRRRRAG